MTTAQPDAPFWTVTVNSAREAVALYFEPLIRFWTWVPGAKEQRQQNVRQLVEQLVEAQAREVEASHRLTELQRRLRLALNEGNTRRARRALGLRPVQEWALPAEIQEQLQQLRLTAKLPTEAAGRLIVAMLANMTPEEAGRLTVALAESEGEEAERLIDETLAKLKAKEAGRLKAERDARKQVG